jgi:hypothetical protein
MRACPGEGLFLAWCSQVKFSFTARKILVNNIISSVYAGNNSTWCKTADGCPVLPRKLFCISVVNIPTDCTKLRVAKPHDAPHIRVYRTAHAASWSKIARPERFYCYKAHKFLNYNTKYCGHTGTFILYPPILISFLYSPHYTFSGLPKLEIKNVNSVILTRTINNKTVTVYSCVSFFLGEKICSSCDMGGSGETVSGLQVL